MSEQDLWRFLIVGYLLTIAIELPVLLVGLSPVHSWRRRIAAAVWLTACTYPIVVLVLPLLLAPFHSRLLYLGAAESFAVAAECILFILAFHERKTAGRILWQDTAAIAAANLLSFAMGELLHHLNAL